MADVFTGAEELKIDPKGRVTIPSRFRRIIEAGDTQWTPGTRPTLYMIFGVTRGEFAWQRLEFMTVRNHEDLIDRLLAKAPENPSAEKWLRIYNNYALPVQLDEEGRLTIPQKHRERLGFDREVQLATDIDRFLLMTHEVYASQYEDELVAWHDAGGAMEKVGQIAPPAPRGARA